MYRKMLLWNMIICLLLCIRITVEVQSVGETHSNARDIIRDGKGSSTTVKVSTSDDTNNVTSREHHNNKTSNNTKHKAVNVTYTKNHQEMKNNQTDGTRLRSNLDSMNYGAVLRGFYVFLGLSVIVIMYFTVRAIRLGRKKTKVKKYGILANREDLEMTPLGLEEDEEDTTVFDLSNHPGQ